MATEDLFDVLRKPNGHQARGCFNCKHHTESVKCAKKSWIPGRTTCIAYFDREHAEMNLVKLAGASDTISAVWQKEWEWNGED